MNDNLHPLFDEILKPFMPEVEKKQDNRKEICDKIAEDAENDARDFDGKPFTGRIVAEYFGNHGASIAALANILKSVLEELEKKTTLASSLK